MDIAIWVVQGILAFAFLMAGAGKLFQPREKLISSGMAYAEDFSDMQMKGIGTLEVLGALGLVLPMLLQIFPILTPFAASGLVIVMLGAMFTHFRRKEYPMIAVNSVLLLMALFVAYGRFVLVPVG